MSVTTSTKSFRDMTRREAIDLCYILEEQRDNALSQRDALAAKVADAWDEGQHAGLCFDQTPTSGDRLKPNPYRQATS